MTPRSDTHYSQRPKRAAIYARTAATLGGFFILLFVGLFDADKLRAVAAETGTQVEIQKIDPGFDGHFKVGYWTPVTIQLHHAGPAAELTIRLTAPDSDAMPTSVTHVVAVPGTDEPGGEAFVEMYTRVGRMTGELSVEVRAAGDLLARSAVALEHAGPLKSSAYLVVTLGALDHVAGAIGSHPRTKSLDARVAPIRDAARLPSNWFGYDGVDVVILCASQQQAVELAAEPLRAKLEALDQWVRGGGRLIVCGGPDGVLTTGRPLARFVPGRFSELVPIRQLNSLEVYAGAKRPLLLQDQRGRPRPFQIPKLTDVRGKILLHEGRLPSDLPLLVQAAYGFGQVVFLAVDLALPQFNGWDGTRNLVAALLDPGAKDRAVADPELTGELAHIGYEDLAGQLRSALDRFEDQGVRFLPFELFFLLTVAYILLIAPVDYFFLRRYVRRMEWTWVTFPLLVIAACGGAYGLARWAKGERLGLNQIDLVDIDQDTGFTRAVSWFSLFSPRTERYNLSLKSLLPEGPSVQQRAGAGDEGAGEGAAGLVQDVAAAEQETAVVTTSHDTPAAGADQYLLSWFGLPGRALGGMQSAAAGTTWDSGYAYSPNLAALEGLPIQVWSTRTLHGQFRGSTSARIEADLAISPASLERLLVGSITHQMNVTLADCVLFYDRWVYPLGTIPPGGKAEVTDQLNIRTVETYLTRHGDWSAETDSQRFDEARVVDRMMFYSAAGGRDFSPLMNRYQSSADLSHLLSAGKAVLVARAADAAFEVQDGRQALAAPAAQRQAIYRFVFTIDL